ncbi:MAG: prepilin-type N-terminal cleavage/methylation domain-containing protein [Dehalococcoidia bacterium]|nr:prepilin-type N-terminal cleavage/methylation domain-containing protein [Dehalococcoidia bacterium]
MKLKSGEKGFTLIELVVGLSIAGFVVGAASMATITMMRLTPQSNNWAIALRQVQNAGHWISRDVQMSRGEILIDPDTDIFLTLTLPQDQDPDNDITVNYQFQDINGVQWLVRSASTGEQTVIAIDISDTDADYVDDPDDQFGGMLTFTITATSGTTANTTETVTREYEAMQRLAPAPAP